MTSTFHVPDEAASIVVAGAGNVGCHVGAHLAAASRNVTLLLREALAATIAQHGLRMSDLDGADEILSPSAVSLTSDPAEAFGSADIVLVTVKSRDTAPIARSIAKYAPVGTIVNALSDLPLLSQIGDRRWRLLISRQMREGLAVMRAAGIRPAPVEGLPPRVIAFALRFPNALFKAAARKMMAIDKNARSSMWEDLRAGRLTEIDYIQGEIVRLADKQRIPAPLTRRVMHLIKEAEIAGKGSPALTPEDVAGGE